MNNTFNELDVDPIVGAEIMGIAGITPDNLLDLNNVVKLREIMKFFGPMKDRGYVISKLITGRPGIDPINHLWGYTKLRTEYEDYLKKSEELKAQLYHYER